MIPQWPSRVAERPRLGGAAWAGAYLLLAVAHVLIGGYQFGVGNQGIQVPLLLRAIDPTLFSNDAMIVATADAYPSYFFRLLAWPAKAMGVERLYLLLHVLTAWAMVAAVVGLGRAMFRSRAVGLVAVAMLLAGHHQALGGDGLYSAGFTHTFAVFPLAIAASALAYRRHYTLAALLAGLTFNLHALTAAYTLAFLAAIWLAERPWPLNLRRAWQAPLLTAVFVAAAFPTLRQMATHRQAFDQQWIGLTHIRSADHSFPSVWWQSGNTDVPRFVLIAGLFALSLGFGLKSRVRRQTLAIVAAAGVLFAIGWLLADVWPVPLVLRAQLFRCSRLVMAVMLVCIAHAAVQSCYLWGWRGWLEITAAALVVATIAVPALLPLLPVAFGVMVLVALLTGRLSIGQAVAAGAVTFVCVAAVRDLDFHLTAKPQAVGFSFGVAAIAATGLLALLARLASRREQWLLPPVAAVAAVVLLAIGLHQTPDARDDVQHWARQHTPADAVFLTESQPGGFRLQSQRAVVGEWRDGTQLYFSAGFAPQWWGRMLDLQPGLLTDATGRSVLSRGRPLAALDDEAIVALAAKYGATHVVLPKTRPRELPIAYENAQLAVYQPQLPPPQPPSEATDKDRWLADEKFMRETVLPNIERHRKGDVKLQLLDAAGRPLSGATVEVRQINSSFNFSASLPFFQKPAGESANRDYHPPPVEQAELGRFLEVFNASMIPFSGKWMYIEPREGERHYEELDRYVQWCTENGIRIEYHFVSGYFAPWMKARNPQQQGEAFLRHAKELAGRYGDRIKYWQVVNENILIQQSPEVFKALRELMPESQLGISHCAKFAPETQSGRKNDRRNNMTPGLEQVRWLRSQGIQLDFFGFHGHRPFGLWPEASQMYASLDEFAREGVRVHITEFTVPADVPVKSPIRGGTFTPETQAQFYERFFTVCFSHPSVDLINIWGIGPNTWQEGSGLLDAQYNPKPAFVTLKKLITQTWRTNLNLKLDIQGLAGFRGFHGDYLATVRTSDGWAMELTFAIPPGDAPPPIRARVGEAGRLVRLP